MATEIDPIPSPVSYKGIGTALEAAGGNNEHDLDHLRKAVAAYRKALETSKKSTTMFYMAVALERLGETNESEQILESMRRSEAPASCLVDSWGYVRWHTRNTEAALLNLHRGTRDMLKLVRINLSKLRQCFVWAFIHWLDQNQCRFCNCSTNDVVPSSRTVKILLFYLIALKPLFIHLFSLRMPLQGPRCCHATH